MKPETGWQAVRTAFQCGRELQALLAALKADCTAEQYKAFSSGIAHAIDVINVELIDRTLAEHPQLKSQIEADLAQYGEVR